jgi:hypothetical protein
MAKVADVHERELEPTIKEWLRCVNLVPELTDLPLSDEDRAGHLPKLYHDLISRPRLAVNAARRFPPPLRRTDECGMRRATLFPCSFRSRACSRSPHSAHYISIGTNSIRTGCF